MNFTTQTHSPAYPGSDEYGSSARPVTVTGASSLLVVFLVLCFVTLAALTLSTAKADSRESQQNAERTALYYAADSTAERLAAQLETRLKAAESTGTAPELSDLGMEQDGDIISYTVRIDERSAIEIELQLTPDGPHYFEVLRWQTTTDAQRAENTLTLIKTEEQP